MRHASATRVAGLAVCATLALAGFAAAAAGSGTEELRGGEEAPAPDGKLVVREHRLDSDVIYFEGYVAFLRVRESDSGAAAIKRRFARRVHLRATLPAGRYRLIRFIRPCEGTCERLDPPTERCAAAVRVRDGELTTAAIRTRAGEDCEVRVKAPGAGARPPMCPAGEPRQFDARRLVGMRLEPATALAKRFDCVVRVVRLDGESLPGTDDYRTDRVNVAVRDGRVTRVENIG